MPENNDYSLFDRSTQALVYGFQANAVQRMLDFDYACRRDNLILNVNGCVGTLCCDMLRGIGFNNEHVVFF